MEKIFNHGYVRLVDHMGSDLSVVNAARVSYNKATDVMREEDLKLIKYLASHGHTSPFRHASLQFEVYAPLLVARQWWKHIIGSAHQDPFTAWNESSRRYVTEEIEFYIPSENEWRSKPDNSKQGSGENVDLALGREAFERLMEQIDEGMKNYNWAIEQGIATEQARLFIPSAYGLMVRWYWTTSLQGLTHFLKLRLDDHAQQEIQMYAKAVEKLAQETFPVSIKALMST